MKRLAYLLVALVAVAGAALGVFRLLRRGPEGGLSVEWRPALALAPGVSVRAGKLAGAPAWRVVDLALDPSRAQLRVARKPSGARLFDLVLPGAVALVNGGYFDPDFRPTGWLVDEGHELSALKSRAQGGVLALKKGALYVGPSHAVPFAPEFALQNSPRLVEPGGAIGIRSDDGRRAARTLACDVDGRLHLVAIAAPVGDGPTLLEAAQLLAAEPSKGGLGCDAALNLDGGPSTGVWLPPSSGLPGFNSAEPIAYALAVLPR